MKNTKPIKRRLELRALTLRNLSVHGGRVAGKDTYDPSACPVSCTTTEPHGCATGDNCVIIRTR
jgi:hypothetical protein